MLYQIIGLISVMPFSLLSKKILVPVGPVTLAHAQVGTAITLSKDLLEPTHEPATETAAMDRSGPNCLADRHAQG